ncbi:MAG: hypothetical protein Q7S00_05820, partial [bacterium]|nr:hypothetical protein [bacterium]
MTQKYYIALGPETKDQVESLDPDRPGLNPLESGAFRAVGLVQTKGLPKPTDVYLIDAAAPEARQFLPELKRWIQSNRFLDTPSSAAVRDLLDFIDRSSPDSIRITIPAAPNIGLPLLRKFFPTGIVEEGVFSDWPYPDKPLLEVMLHLDLKAHPEQVEELKAYRKWILGRTGNNPGKIIDDVGAAYLNLFLFADEQIRKHAAKNQKKRSRPDPVWDQQRYADPKNFTVSKISSAPGRIDWVEVNWQNGRRMVIEGNGVVTTDANLPLFDHRLNLNIETVRQFPDGSTGSKPIRAFNQKNLDADALPLAAIPPRWRWSRALTLARE